MQFTQKEREKLSLPELRPYCMETDNRYVAKAKINGKIVTGKKFDTIPECNAYHDKMMEREE